ncbi:MAG: anthranilate phosphoribosyltransferase [Gammaproteobacteria bacterium]|nr:anthranilate phosphoribosyltransferase [Gammaproteobacteria bacterium]
MPVNLSRLLAGERLSRQESHDLFEAVIRGELSDVELTALLVALKLQGETPEQIAGAAAALREGAREFPRPDYRFADIVGTGGDGASTINISTAVSFVAAEAGLPVAKHGNRSVSSRCGAADLLEQFGLRLDMAPTTARRCLDELGVSFLFAPHYHSGIRHAMPVRKALGTRTLFNILGPLVNPARPPVMLVGVYEPGLCTVLAETLKLLGCERALVVNGLGLDEIAVHGETLAAELRDGEVRSRCFSPADFGVREFPLSAIVGGEPEDNARAIERLLGGEGEEAHRAAVAVNAGALLHIAGIAADFREGFQRAQAVLDGDGGLRRLQAFAALSREVE